MVRVVKLKENGWMEIYILWKCITVMREMMVDTNRNILYTTDVKIDLVAEKLVEYYNHFTHKTLRMFNSLYAAIAVQNRRKRADNRNAKNVTK